MDNTVISIGIIASIIWFFASLLMERKNFGKSLISAILFAIWYIVIYLIGDYLYNFINNANVYINRYSIGITAIILWFLLSLILEDKFKNTLKNTGMFAIYVFFAEILYGIAKNMNF